MRRSVGYSMLVDIILIAGGRFARAAAIPLVASIAPEVIRLRRNSVLRAEGRGGEGRLWSRIGFTEVNPVRRSARGIVSL
jgi:hypothetical protein